MKTVITFLCLALLTGCSTYREFSAAPDRYTTMKVGEIYQFQQDMLLVKYDYLIIPLVKPGIQLIPASAGQALSKELSIVGHAKKGETCKITSYENEGGWIPCKGDWYKVNPMVVVLNGELKGRRAGVSLLCDDDTDKLPFRTGKIYFAKPNEKFLKKKA